MTEKLINQNSGFIQAESRRALEHLERSRQMQAEGKERASKALQTRAMNEIQRIEKAATTIRNRSK